MRNSLIFYAFLVLTLALSGCAGGRKQPLATTGEIPVIPPDYKPKQTKLTEEQKHIKLVLKKNGFGKIGRRPTVIVVRKQPRKLTIYKGLTPLKTYPVVLGANPRNDKLCQGDRCTPEGVYRVVCKFDHLRWDKFILLDYPNTQNWLKFSKAKKKGKVPFDARIGGDIGIHGTHDPFKNVIGEDWTLGCVSMLNQHIQEIYPLVDDNTLVVIKRK
jgi:murein L,D-transpeptidase YafK